MTITIANTEIFLSSDEIITSGGFKLEGLVGH